MGNRISKLIVRILIRMLQQAALPAALFALGAPRMVAQQNPMQQSARLQAVLRSPKPELQIGALDGDSTQVFGRISHLVVDSAVGIFILDPLANQVRWFDLHGRYRGSAGRTGGGPGEFRGPIRLAVDAQRRVHVLDVRGKIGVFAASAAGLKHLKDVRTEVNGDRFCIMNDGYFLLSPYTPQVIRRLTAEGKLVASFGQQINTLGGSVPPPSEGAGTFFGRQNMAVMFCSATRQIIVLVHESAPVIRAFRTNGQLLWENRLRDHRQVREVPVPGRSGWRTLAGDPKTGTWTTVNGVIPIADDKLAVSLSEGPFKRGSQFAHEVRVFSLLDGREIERFKTATTFATGIGSRIFTVSHDPFPHVLAFSMK